MHSILLPDAIDLTSYNNRVEIIDDLYRLYKSELMEKDNRVKLFNKFIYIDCKWIDYKAEMFWHLISLTEDERFKNLPCESDNLNVICNNNCIQHLEQITLSNGQVRDICYFRAIRLKWINEIIKLANRNDPHIKKWAKDGKLHIRFQHETADYILIFLDKLNNGKYYFISAFPVFYPDSKRNYDIDFENFQKSKNR